MCVYVKERESGSEEDSTPQPSPPPPTAPLGPLRKHIPQRRIVPVPLHVVHPHVALQVVRPGVPVLLVRAEGTRVSRRGVDESVPNFVGFVRKGWEEGGREMQI